MLKLEDDGRWYLNGSPLLAGDTVRVLFPAVGEWYEGRVVWEGIGMGEYMVAFDHGEPAGERHPIKNFEAARAGVGLRHVGPAGADVREDQP